MKAYTVGITKKQFVAEMKEHKRLDHFLKGTYSKGLRGCAVGCGIKSINKLKNRVLDCSVHKHLETYLGIPEWLANLQDAIFEEVDLDRSKSWPVEFAEAINEGADLNKIKIPFIVYILNQNINVQEENLTNTEDEEVKEIIQEVIKVNKQMIEAQLAEDKKLIEVAWSAARYAESAARSAARYAAEYSAGSAARYAAEYSAESAAESAARCAESAARSAEYSAESTARYAAEYAAESAARCAESAVWSVWSAAWSSAYEKYADELLRLMRECK